MLGESLQSLLAWVVANPHWIGLLLFLVAFLESLALIGFVMPGAVILFASGGLVASGAYPLGDALLYATLGAILGDGLSYWLGRHYQQQLRCFWPLCRYPDVLSRGEQFFFRHGGKSVALGRFVGPIRAVVPAVAGMMGMSPLRFYTVNILSAIVWAPAYILPGVVFAASLSLAAEAAGRLVVLLLLLAIVMLFSLWLLRRVYQLLSPRLEARVMALHGWLTEHPRWGRYLLGIVDPQLSAFKGLLFWGAGLMICSAGFAWLLLIVQQGSPLALDQQLWQFLQGLRTPLMDNVMVAITRLGDGRVSVPLVGILGLWLWWRGASQAALYLLATLLFALSVPLLLKVGLQLPRPGNYGEGVTQYGFPSWHATMAMLLYGFVALLVARELKPEQRWLAYGVALIPIGLISFSRLYLGVHWLSDVLAGLALAGAWLTMVAIAYARHQCKPLSWRSLLLVLFAGGSLLSSIHLLNSDADPHYQATTMPSYSQQQWQQGEPSITLVGASREMSLQWLGARASIRQQLLDEGWVKGAQVNWLTPLNWLLPITQQITPAVLPHYYAGSWDGLRMFRFEEGHWQVLRLWPRAMVAGRPLWWGELVVIEEQPLLGLLYLPRSGKSLSNEQLQALWPAANGLESVIRLQSRGEGQ